MHFLEEMDLNHHLEVETKWNLDNTNVQHSSDANSSDIGEGHTTTELGDASCSADMTVSGADGDVCGIPGLDESILKKGNSILDGKYFVVIERNDRKIKCACQSCPTRKVLSARIDALSNLVTHMKRVHPNKLEEMELYRNTKGRRRKRGVVNGLNTDLLQSTFLPLHKRQNMAGLTDDKLAAITGATSTTPGAMGGTGEDEGNVSTSTAAGNMQKLSDPIKNFYASQVNRVTQKDADAAVATYIVQGFHPLSTVEQPEFRELVAKLNPSVVVLSRRSVGRHIDNGYTAMLAAIQEEVGQQRYACTTADVCNAGQGSYLAVTLHWIERSSLERRSAAIACRRVAQKEQRVAETIEEIQNTFNVRDRKLVARITDNVTNSAEAFKEFNITVSTGKQGFRGDDDEEEEEEYDNNGALRDLSGLGSVGPSSISSAPPPVVSQGTPTDLHVILPSHVSCSSHLLDQVITVDAKHALQTKTFANINSGIFGKCSALWKIANKPKSSRIIRDRLGCMLKTPCPSKWTTIYDSVGMILKFKDKMNEVMHALQLPEFQVMDYDFLLEYSEIVKPIAVAVKRLQDEKQWYYGELIPTLLVTDNKLDIMQHNLFRYCYPLFHAINYGFKTRFGQYLNLQREVSDALLATVSHPYFKLRWLHSRPALNTEPMRKHLHTMLLEAIIQNNDYAVSQSDDTTENSTEDDFYDFNEFKNRSSITSMAVSRDIEMQVYNYFQESDTRLAVLHNYPAVREVFLRHNTSILSSAPVEKLLGFGGLLQTRKKTRLSDGLFEKLVLMKGNRHKFE